MRTAFLRCATLAACGVMAMAAWAEPAAAPGVRLLRSGNVSTALVQHVEDYVRENLRFPVQLGPDRAAPASTLPLEKEGVPVSDGDLLTVVLADSPASETNTTLVFTDRQTVVVNVSALRDDNAETQARRVDRLVLRGIARVLGLEQCPNPFCCLWGEGRMEDLDAMGRNYCPPCQEKAQNRGRDLGVKWIEIPTEIEE